MPILRLVNMAPAFLQLKLRLTYMPQILIGQDIGHRTSDCKSRKSDVRYQKSHVHPSPIPDSPQQISQHGSHP